MNLFKGLLYLIENDTPASPVLIQARHYGAATAANEFADELGNRAVSRRLFGATAPAADPAGDEPIAAAGGCR